MSEEKMKNPYGDKPDDDEVRLSRGAACAVIAAFFLIVLLPPLYRNVYEATVGGDGTWIPVIELFKKPADQKITKHLKSFEKDLEDKAAFTEPPRQLVQAALAGGLREGNRKTYIGRDGWLYLKPALDSLTGYGPITPEPDSVAKDPNRTPWGAPLGTIKTFAAQLDDLGVELVLVPIPVKPMIYPEHITGKQPDRPLVHRDSAEFYAQINSLPNARVVDLTGRLWDAKSEQQIFLKQDTHWTPEGMSIVARELASNIGTKKTSDDSALTTSEVENIGDLVEQLNLPGDGTGKFRPESATITKVEGFSSTPTSHITLLGDSFTNIYSLKSLNWGEHAGFAQHLAHELGQPIDVIAMNGQASTGVRKALAKRGREHLSKKKVVIWAIAARDLFLSETTARQNEVEWDDVLIPDIADPFASEAMTGPIKIRGTLLMKSAIVDPKTVTYKNAIFVCEYRVEEVIEGTYTGDTILVKHWAFRDGDLSGASDREIDAEVEVELDLVLFETKPELLREQGFDDFDADVEKMLAPRYWVVGESETVANPSDPVRANVIATIVCVLATLLVMWIAIRLRGSDVRDPA